MDCYEELIIRILNADPDEFQKIQEIIHSFVKEDENAPDLLRTHP